MLYPCHMQLWPNVNQVFKSGFHMGATRVDWQDESRYFSKKRRREKNVLVWFMEFKLKSDHKRTERLGHLVERAVWSLREVQETCELLVSSQTCHARSITLTAPQLIGLKRVSAMRVICAQLCIFSSRSPSWIQTAVPIDATQTFFYTCTIWGTIWRGIVLKSGVGYVYGRTWKLYARERSLLFACY